MNSSHSAVTTNLCNSKKLLLTALISVIILSAPARAQITISTNQYNPPVGAEIVSFFDFAFDESSYNLVAAGSGGPIEWDFSDRIYDTGESLLSVDPAETPSIGMFPGANLVLFAPVTPEDSSWDVFNTTTSSITNLGFVTRGPLLGSLETVYEDLAPDYQFPIQFNGNWTSYFHLTSVLNGETVKRFDTTDYRVDAWGTAKYLSNSVPCLRVLSESRTTRQTFNDQNILMSSSVDTSWGILLIGEDSNTLWYALMYGGANLFYDAEATSSLLNSQSPSCCVTPGDYTNDGKFNIADVTSGIARVFTGGGAPACRDQADYNGDNKFNIADLTSGIARLFTGGAAPVCGTTGN